MTDTTDTVIILDLLVDIFVVIIVLLRTAFERIAVPPLVGYLILGLVIGLINGGYEIISPSARAVFEFLGSVGLIILLFRVGLESNLHELFEKLPRAIPIWIGNVVVSGVPAFIVSRALLDLSLVPSLFIAVALTATSIAVSVEMWRDAGALRSANGETLIDVAELDDLSGVALMAVLVALAPALHFGGNGTATQIIAPTAAWLALKALMLGVICVVIARYGEVHLSSWLSRTAAPNSILIVIAIGIIIAATAALLGFTLAIGALFAGLIFSRDPRVVRMETSFEPLHALFTPFFFIGIGLGVDAAAIVPGVVVGLVLLAVAVIGKIVGAGVPALLTTGATGAAMIGVSMVPRAEIAMIVVQQGHALGEWAVPSDVYAAIAFVSIVTCVAAPLALRAMLRRWPQSSPD